MEPGFLCRNLRILYHTLRLLFFVHFFRWHSFLPFCNLCIWPVRSGNPSLHRIPVLLLWMWIHFHSLCRLTFCLRTCKNPSLFFSRLVLGKKNFLGSLLPRKTFLNRPLIPLNLWQYSSWPGLWPHTRRQDVSLLGLNPSLQHLSIINYWTDLFLSRTMLTEASSAYVDRFACDWHRFSTTDLDISPHLILYNVILDLTSTFENK